MVSASIASAASAQPMPQRRKAPPPAPSHSEAIAAATAATTAHPELQHGVRPPAKQNYEPAAKTQTRKTAAPTPPAKKVAPKPPPAPPAPPSAPVQKPKYPTYKVLYDYDGSVSGSVPLVKDDIMYVVNVNGQWGLVKDLKETIEGWAPFRLHERG
ncbi:hypothetical protein CLUG_02555 [Clavispora lusitaniae ATCC 42720]|uniref:SH3 domain-containing protein n=1 Tax=Clavispora lusitaniae (strain ATCC 42720) TaxID=306902 RepID=C4Y4I3_CLAL4|nr:uncharacterized protein CLUG_02555 [Clavispora lusitaniae ATCC 42720]EEQ38429.1 hypothetical protein CLUG_02555 [Clavispora lusitaniae ATCC 42720]